MGHVHLPFDRIFVGGLAVPANFSCSAAIIYDRPRVRTEEAKQEPATLMARSIICT
jgi:hypothetical protein